MNNSETENPRDAITRLLMLEKNGYSFHGNPKENIVRFGENGREFFVSKNPAIEVLRALLPKDKDLKVELGLDSETKRIQVSLPYRVKKDMERGEAFVYVFDTKKNPDFNTDRKKGISIAEEPVEALGQIAVKYEDIEAFADIHWRTYDNTQAIELVESEK